MILPDPVARRPRCGLDLAAFGRRPSVVWDQARTRTRGVGADKRVDRMPWATLPGTTAEGSARLTGAVARRCLRALLAVWWVWRAGRSARLVWGG